MYWHTDPLVYFLMVQKYGLYSLRLRHLKIAARVALVVVLISIFSVALPFATQPKRTVGVAESPIAEAKQTIEAEPAQETPTKVPAVVVPVVVEPNKSQELQAAIDDWVAAHKGTVSVTVRGITDPAVSASNKGAAKMYTASIYKMYAIGLMYQKINSGAWAINRGGINTDSCVERMIVVSDNSCAVAFGNLLGWQAADGELQAQGYIGTSLNINHPWSTSNDVAELMVRLEKGEFVNAAQRQAMVGYMKRQIYRSGIPAGSPNSIVANKVGFFDSYNTDAGIVYGPKNTYVVSIMTNGTSFAAIADLSAVIAGVMNK